MFERLRKPATPVSVVLYTRADCPLCDEMEAEVARAGRAGRFRLRKVDVDSDRGLKKRFGLRIPVLEIDGEVAFEARLTAGEFRRRIDAAVRAGDS